MKKFITFSHGMMEFWLEQPFFLVSVAIAGIMPKTEWAWLTETATKINSRVVTYKTALKQKLTWQLSVKVILNLFLINQTSMYFYFVFYKTLLQ